MVEMSLTVRQANRHAGAQYAPHYEVAIWNHSKEDEHDSGCLFSINFDNKEICLYDYADALEELFGASNNVIVVYRKSEGRRTMRVPDGAF